MQVFNDPQASKNDVAAAGEAFLCVVYGGKIDDNLDVKRHQLYLRTIAKQKVCAKFDLATLPPTSAVARQHLFRVYHQVQQWRGVALNRTDWGWRLKDGCLTPLPTLREPAPELLLHLITCNCRSGCERNKAVRQSPDLLFIATSFWFEESPCAVRTNTAGLGRLCTLFVWSTLLIFEHTHAVLSSTLVLCYTMVTTSTAAMRNSRYADTDRMKNVFLIRFSKPHLDRTKAGRSECLQTGRLYHCLYQEGHLHVFIEFYR